jgi:hypothetical protein
MELTAEQMMKAFGRLDELLDRPLRLIIGGGGAMLLAYEFPLVTDDVDGVPAAGGTLDTLPPLVQQVGRELGISQDWLNPYYSTFMHVLPSDYGSRLEMVFGGKHLRVEALSINDLLIMKCFAGRPKDIKHARMLIEKGGDVAFVEKHIESLAKKNIPRADRALDFLDELKP